jgi:DNA repair photolyase
MLPTRGSAANPQNRFERLRCEPEIDIDLGYVEEDEKPLSRTVFLRDLSASILSKNESPDLGFGISVNPYRGCEHGCAYCYARPTHEYLGFSPGLDFETKILVKPDAPRLLREALASPKWEPQTVMMSGVTDCYQPAEHRFRVTRGCLEVFAAFRNPVSIITKNHLVTRDIDLLQELAAHRAVSVTLSITSLDPELARRLEPRASLPARRLGAIEKLSRAGIPVSVNVAPIIPGLNDHEIPQIVAAARTAGAVGAGYTLVRLPYGVKDLFAAWLETHYPQKKEGVLGRICDHRGGKLYDAKWGTRRTGHGAYADNIAEMMRVAVNRAKFPARPGLSAAAFRRPGGAQLELL